MNVMNVMTYFRQNFSNCFHKYIEFKTFRSIYTQVRHRQVKNILDDELKIFRKIAPTVWSKSGMFGPLHSMNELRVSLIRDRLTRSEKNLSSLNNEALPLEGLQLLDIGCGGGILSEPLAALGASVTGIDPIQEMIDVAKHHSSQNPHIKDRLHYICGTIEDIAEPVKYDGIIASEVLEHIDNLDYFCNSCIGLLKENGSIFITTINRTWSSYLLAIVAAEWILGLIPRGTHTWEKFILPSELQSILEINGCHIKLIHGMGYNPVTDNWFWTTNKNINYVIHAVKSSIPVTNT